MFAVAAIRSIRYRDMLSASPGPRTIMRTFAAWAERKTARLAGRISAADEDDLLAGA